MPIYIYIYFFLFFSFFSANGLIYSRGTLELKHKPDMDISKFIQKGIAPAINIYHKQQTIICETDIGKALEHQPTRGTEKMFSQDLVLSKPVSLFSKIPHNPYTKKFAFLDRK